MQVSEMSERLLLMVLIGICSVIFIIGFIFKRMDILIRGAIRGITGSVVIYGIGFIMQAVGCVSLVGLNLWTAGVCTVLGLPGMVVLYVIAVLNML